MRLVKAFITPSLPMSKGYYGVIDLDSCVCAYKYKYTLSHEEEIELIKVIYSGGASVDIIAHETIAKELGL